MKKEKKTTLHEEKKSHFECFALPCESIDVMKCCSDI